LTCVDKTLSLIPNNEELEAVQVPYEYFEKYGKRNSNGELAATLESFNIEKVIGRGGFSKVLLVRHRATGQMYAMKVLRKDKIKQDNKVE
jgi:serine/threonine protein kinase